MKKTLFFLFLFLNISLISFAQEPGNNLLKTIPELREKFPDLIEWGMYGHYKSPESNILFGTKKGVVISEFTIFEGEDGFLQDLYDSLVQSYSKSARNYIKDKDRNSITYIYSNFSVSISYTYDKNLSISYDLLPKYIPH